MKKKIEIGKKYKHKPSSLPYIVHGIYNDAAGYEETGILKMESTVLYEQLEDGEVSPKGTMWTRSIIEFIEFFEMIE